MATDTARPNKATPEMLKSFIDRIENRKADILSVKGRYMKEIQDIQSDIADIFEEAKNRGVNKKSLKTVLSEIDLRRKLDALTENLDDDQIETVKDIREALGDDFAGLPLGMAAVKKDDAQKAPVSDTASKLSSANKELSDEEKAEAKAAQRAKADKQRKEDAKAFDDEADKKAAKSAAKAELLKKDEVKSEKPVEKKVAATPSISPANARRNRGSTMDAKAAARATADKYFKDSGKKSEGGTLADSGESF